MLCLETRPINFSRGRNNADSCTSVSQSHSRVIDFPLHERIFCKYEYTINQIHNPDLIVNIKAVTLNVILHVLKCISIYWVILKLERF